VVDEFRMDGDIRVDLNATVEGLVKELRILRDRLSERDAKIAVLQSQLMEANINADKIAHELGVCYDHDHGCGGAGPVEEQIKAIKRLYQEHAELADLRLECDRLRSALKVIQTMATYQEGSGFLPVLDHHHVAELCERSLAGRGEGK
jgi:hypothetical protein